VLRFGSAAWQKGKVRLGLAIEFAPSDGSHSEPTLELAQEEAFQLLAEGEVVYVQNTYRVSELTAKIRSQVASALAEWSSAEGIDGEVLRFSSQAWQKGKVRLNLTLKFAPGDGQVANPDNSIPPVPNNVLKTSRTTVLPPTINQTNQTKVMDRPVPTIENLTVPPANPKIESTLEDDHFELGTMSPVTGEIEMNLIDNEGEQSGYTDFDLSAAIPEVNLDELVSRSSVSRPSLIDEVWNEMSQPNWPGIGRA
jgi:KGK domain